ncbi:hypothetical protein [Streptosporangium sp. NPDC002524]|uniref:hypothetical protein n=1 Tax=Streptosporangium sp. NPDC002524 TaxID=3154537 RepID=UPI003326735C
MDRSRASLPAVDAVTAENQDKALAVVQRLLQERGVRTRRHNMISLGLFADRAAQWPDQPPVTWSMERHPPELAVIGSEGCRDATVRMGACAGCYVVAVRGGDTETVRCDEPERVLDLILAMGGTP